MSETSITRLIAGIRPMDRPEPFTVPVARSMEPAAPPPPSRIGWECPKCGGVMAPNVACCLNCRPSTAAAAEERDDA